MAAQDYASVVQQLYVSYFGRPADYYGLQNFEQALDAMGAPTTFAGVQAAVQADAAGTTALSKLVNSFNASAESAALYGTDNSQVGVAKFVNAIYANVLGREADISGFNYWVNAISSGQLTKANAAAAITAAASTNTSAQGLLDAQTVANKLSVATTFTNDLDTPSKITAYSGDAAAAAARTLLSGVSNTTDTTAYQNNVNAAIDQLMNVTGQTYALTSGVDSLVGTANNDTFNALPSATNGATLGAFDSINGGGGNNTLNISDVGTGGLATVIPSAVTITNIQSINVQSAQIAGANIDTSGITGVKAVAVSAAAGQATVNASATTAISASAMGIATVTGGSSQAVSSAGGATVSGATGAVSVADGKLAAGAISVNGGANVAVTASGVTTGTVNVGATAAPTGAVAVTTTSAASTVSSTQGTITIKGGTSVTVMENLAAPTPAAGAGTFSTTGAAVTVNGTAATTSVNVTQTAAVAPTAGAAAVAATAGTPAVTAQAQVDTITIATTGAVLAGETFTATVNSTPYVFTAAGGETASQIATGLAGVIAAAGVTAAASGANVTLTANPAGTAFVSSVAENSAAATATDSTTTTNRAAAAAVGATAAVDAKAGTGGIIDGAVTITDLNAANTDGTKVNTIKTVVLDGYGTAAVNSNALTQLSLANSASAVTVTDATATATNTTLALAVNNLATGAALNDASIKTLNVTTGAKASALILNAANVTKVSAAGAGDLALDLTGAGKVLTFDGSTATGAINLSHLHTATSAAVAATSTVAAVAAVNVSVSTGAGADTVDVTGITGSGNFTVATGAGNDTIVVAQGQLVAGNSINGGAGTDTIKLTNGTAAFAAGDYALINSLVTNVEGAEFTAAVGGIDASKVAFTSLAFDNTAIVTGVSTQTLSTSGASLNATTSGYSVSGATTTYGGNLTVTDTHVGASALTLNADTATVNVNSTTTGAAAATIGGHLQTSLTVNLANAANAASNPTGDFVSSANVTLSSTVNQALKSIVLTGAGNVVIDASAAAALTNVDASKLGGTVANGTTKGAITGGLDFTGNVANAETVTLGSGHDIIRAGSNYGNLDTIVGFDAVQEGTTGASTSDVLIFNGVTLNGLTALVSPATTVPGITKLTLAAGDSTLDLAFVHAAAASHTASPANSIVEFSFGGNTYLFADSNNNGTLDNADAAIKLVGNVDVSGAFGIHAV
jgi:hypothetical protein